MMKSIARMKAVMIKEIRQLSRDRITFGMVVMIPLIQLLLFGFAINTDIRNIPVGVVDQSGSTAGRIITQSVKVPAPGDNNIIGRSSIGSCKDDWYINGCFTITKIHFGVIAYCDGLHRCCLATA